MNRVVVDARAAKRLASGHPWAFSNQVVEVSGKPQPGELVEVAGPAGVELGTAFYNPHSLIAVRLLSAIGALADGSLVSARLRAARVLRERLYPGSDCWRLCHGEADFLPGLFVDRYGDAFVVQAFSAGADRLLPIVAEVLEQEHGARSVLERDESHVRTLEGLPQQSRLLRGETPEPRVVAMPPVKLLVDPGAGQKTGAFLDQRENRLAAARHATGRRAYDAYCNLGGFGVAAALAGAEAVTLVDSSAEAIAGARANAELNGVAGKCEAVVADATTDMDARHRRRERFGVVLIDPPSFTRSRKQVPQARRALRDLNRRAMTLVEPGGVLVTSDCSHHVLEETFLELLRDAAHEAQRVLRILEQRSQSPDHPWLAEMPESKYLKCVILQVL
jgi:23S rRNA (cytosine1962-C5)-methyltransferase